MNFATFALFVFLPFWITTMNTTTTLILAATAALPTTLCAQSLFHAPLPPQQQYQPQPAPQPAPAAAPAQAQPAPATPASDATAPAATTPQQPTTPPAPQQPAPTPAAPTPTTAAFPPVAYQQPTNAAAAISLFAVKPMVPRKFAKQDKIEIIVNETSQTKFEQSADDKENADISAQLKAFIDLKALFTDLQLETNGTETAKIAAGNSSKYKGDGKYERKERMTARISAIVTDVKPNGMLVVEARETVISDKEAKSMVVSGLCDPKDVTIQNTVQSSQLANLVIKTEHSGDVKDSATKGWLPRIFDTLTGNN